jgi:signal transduction histidine kinase
MTTKTELEKINASKDNKSLPELRLSILIENLEGAVLVEDSERRILHVNQVFCNAFKLPYKPAEMIGWDCSQSAEQSKLLFKDPDHFIKRVSEILLARTKCIDESFEMIDGRFLERDYIPIFLDEKYEGHMWVYRDVTQKIESQNLLKLHQAKMLNSSKLASLGEMAAGLAHEINNPLAILVARAIMVRRECLAGRYKTEDVIKSMDIMEKTCHRIEKIIQGLRSFSKGNENLPKQSYTLDVIINPILEFYAERFRRNNIEIKINIDPTITLFCQDVHITQIFINLLNNSIDAISDLQEKWISIQTSKVDNKCILTLTDSGSGISESVADKLFNPFFTTKDVGKGTGLGLSIAIGIAQEHDGHLWYDSSCKNTRFVLELPLFPAN